MSRFIETNATNQNKDVLALLTMLSSPEDLRQKLEELERREKALDEKIALAGAADEILTMRANIVIMQDEAVAALEEAKQKAAQIQADAVVKADAQWQRALSDITEARQSFLLEKEAALAEIAPQYEDLRLATLNLEENTKIRDNEYVSRSQLLEEEEANAASRRAELYRWSEGLAGKEAEVKAKALDNQNLLNQLFEWQTELDSLCDSWKRGLDDIARVR